MAPRRRTRTHRDHRDDAAEDARSETFCRLQSQTGYVGAKRGSPTDPQRSRSHSPIWSASHDVVTFLNGLFTRFDVAAQDLGIEKIKTVGDAYMAVCGLPVPVANHAERMVRMAIRMVHITREHAMEHNISIKLRVGVNSGPVVASVIGKSRFRQEVTLDAVEAPVDLRLHVAVGGDDLFILMTPQPVPQKRQGALDHCSWIGRSRLDCTLLAARPHCLSPASNERLIVIRRIALCEGLDGRIQCPQPGYPRDLLS